MLSIAIFFCLSPQAPDNEWIQQTTNHLIVDHITSAGSSENPLSTVIYWMPRIPPTNGLDQRTWGGQFQYWVVPVWPVTAPTDGPIATTNRVLPRPATVPQSKPESYVYHLRTTDVAHWLHISTQDLVAFLSLAHPRELEALNLYLNFRRELMLYIPCIMSDLRFFILCCGHTTFHHVLNHFIIQHLSQSHADCHPVGQEQDPSWTRRPHV